MGFLANLFGPKKPAFTDWVWMTTERKLRDLAVAVSEDLKAGRPVMVVVHFVATEEAVRAVFEQAGLAVNLVADERSFPREAATVRNGQGVWLLRAAAIPENGRAGDLGAGKHAEVQVRLAEHHPLFEEDDKVLALRDWWPLAQPMTAYVGLDEPLIRIFGGERLQSTMQQLGMDERELLTHPMLGKSIASGRRRSASRFRLRNRRSHAMNGSSATTQNSSPDSQAVRTLVNWTSTVSLTSSP